MILQILTVPNELLKEQSTLVTEEDIKSDEMQQLVDDMIETRQAVDALGLAAVQVGKPIQLFVMNIPGITDNEMVIFNPMIDSANSEIAPSDEGCLSLPGYHRKVNRATSVGVKGLDRNGEELSFQANGVAAFCVQHELDHLRGKTIIDDLSSLKKSFAMKKVKKALKAVGL